MNQFILILVLSILSLFWPLSVLQARCVGNRNIGIGGNTQPFEVPAVNERVSLQGFSLKVNRVKWSIQKTATQPVTAVFKDESTAIRAISLPNLPPNKTLKDLALASNPWDSPNIRLESIRTAFDVRGIKASYGGAPNLLSQNVQLIRYYFQTPAGKIICFEVVPTRKFVNWSDSNDLILNSLSQN